MPPTFAAWAKAVASIPSHIKVLTEVGRSVHTPTGWALSEVVSTKRIDGRETSVIHLGADLLLRRVYRAEQWDHEFVVLNPDGTPKQGPERPTQIAGPLCFSGDLFALDRPLPVAEPGDLLMIRDTGALVTSETVRDCCTPASNLSKWSTSGRCRRPLRGSVGVGPCVGDKRG